MAVLWSVDKQFDRFSRFTAVARGKFAWYQKIYDFLIDEARVCHRLEQLAASAAPLSPASFTTALARLESDQKFADPIRIGKLEYPDTFKNYLRTKRPLNDAGVPAETHGVLTHRIQWAICTLELKATLSGGLSMSDLYSGLGEPGVEVPRDRATDGSSISQQNPTHISLWDVLFDSPYLGANKKWQVRNARSPEFLMSYMQSRPSDPLRQMYLLSKSA